MSSRRRFLTSGGHIGLTFAAAKSNLGYAQVPDIESLNRMVESFMATHRIPGGSLAVTKAGRLVYARGFGSANSTRPVQATDLFRIASISKALTAVAVLQLVEGGKLAIDASVWTVLNLPHPFDFRWKSITIQHLLHHTGGWDDRTFDPMFQSTRIAGVTHRTLPMDHATLIQYMLNQSLHFAPGERFGYSNFGYCLLGRVVEHVTGVSYERYVTTQVLSPLGIRRMRLGKTSPELRAVDEVVYHDDKARTAPSVIDDTARQVPLPYGAWSLELMDANGGWLASTPDLAKFACAFDDPTRCPILKEETVALMTARPTGPAGVDAGGNYPGCGWFVWPPAEHAHKAHMSSNGLLPGTSSYLMRRRDGVNWAVLFNKASDANGKPLMLNFRDVSSAVFNAIDNWPMTDQFPRLL